MMQKHKSNSKIMDWEKKIDLMNTCTIYEKVIGLWNFTWRRDLKLVSEIY